MKKDSDIASDTPPSIIEAVQVHKGPSLCNALNKVKPKPIGRTDDDYLIRHEPDFVRQDLFFAGLIPLEAKLPSKESNITEQAQPATCCTLF